MVISELAKAHKEKGKGKKEVAIYEAGFFTIGGFISGFLLAYGWDKLGFPHRDDQIKRSLVTYEPIETHKKTTIGRTTAMSLAGILIAAEAFAKVKGGTASAAGVMLGYEMAVSLKKDERIGKL